MKGSLKSMSVQCICAEWVKLSNKFVFRKWELPGHAKTQPTNKSPMARYRAMLTTRPTVKCNSEVNPTYN